MNLSTPPQPALLQEAIASALSSDKQAARDLLKQVTTRYPENELAWLWLATLAQDIEEAAHCMARVLQINPHNERARDWMEKWQGAITPPTCTVPEPTVPPNLRSASREITGTNTILVADDSPTIRKLVQMTLEKHGHQVLAATDGLDALRKLNEVVPDLILSDINMPHLDGYQLCKMIRGNAVTRSVPVVMLSGKDGIFDKLRGQLVGATAYLTKPFEIESLLHLIDLHCQQTPGT